MSTPQQNTVAPAVASLYIEAIRQGQSLWFRAASGSMRPIICTGDTVHIEPASGSELQPGEIAAFDTPDGLVIHRIVQHQQTGTGVRLLQMSDVDLQASWIEEQAIVGRVILTRRGARQVDLQRLIAKKVGVVTAYLRFQFYRLYECGKSDLVRMVSHKCSRLVVYLGYWCIRTGNR